MQDGLRYLEVLMRYEEKIFGKEELIGNDDFNRTHANKKRTRQEDVLEDSVSGKITIWNGERELDIKREEIHEIGNDLYEIRKRKYKSCRKKGKDCYTYVIEVPDCTRPFQSYCKNCKR